MNSVVDEREAHDTSTSSAVNASSQPSPPRNDGLQALFGGSRTAARRITSQLSQLQATDEGGSNNTSAMNPNGTVQRNSSSMSGILTRFLPSVESFFLVNASKIDDSKESDLAARLKKQTEETLSLKKSESR